MSRPKERDEQEALKLDELFKKCLARVRPNILALTDPEDVQLCRVWLDKLNHVSAQRALRNDYLIELCRQVETGHVGGLFAEPPPNGKLLPLPKSYSMTNLHSPLSAVSDASIDDEKWSEPYIRDEHRQFVDTKSTMRRREVDYTNRRGCNHGRMMSCRSHNEIRTLNRKQLPIYEKRINTLINMAKKLRIRNEQLNQELISREHDTMDDQTAHLKCTIGQLTAELTKSKSKQAEERKRKEFLEINCREIVKCKNTMNHQMNELNGRLRKVLSENHTLNNNVISLTQQLDNVSRVKEEEIRAIESDYMDRLEVSEHQYENLINQKDRELEKRDILLDQKTQELTRIESRMKDDIEILTEEIRQLTKKLDVKEADENNIKRIITEQCATMQQEFDKLRSNVEIASDNRNSNLNPEVLTLRKSILKLEKSKEKLTNEYEKKIYHMRKDKEMQIKALELQLQNQRSELSMTLGSEKQCELDTIVGDLEERYKKIVATADPHTAKRQPNKNFTM